MINETRFVRRESKGLRSCERSVLLVMRGLGFCGLNRVERRREDEIATRTENHSVARVLPRRALQPSLLQVFAQSVDELMCRHSSRSSTRTAEPMNSSRSRRRDQARSSICTGTAGRSSAPSEKEAVGTR